MSDFDKLRSQQKLLNDKSNIGLRRYSLVERAFELHDPTRNFSDLNPQVQEMWLEIGDAILRIQMNEAIERYKEKFHEARGQNRDHLES